MVKDNTSMFQEAHKYHQDENLADAETLYNEILETQPENIDTIFFLGTLKLQQGNLEEARTLLEKVTKLKPDHATAYNNLGTVLKEQGKPEEAVKCYNKSIILKPDYAMAHCNSGNLLKELGRFEEAEASCRRAISLQPDYADAHNNLGSTLQKRGKFDEAIISYNRSIKLSPDSISARINKSVALLLTENFEEGWPEYEWRLHTKNCIPRAFKQPRWDGSTLNGKSILVHVEQGFGDTIQFVRYLPMVQAKSGHVIFECQKELVSLLKNCNGIDRIVEISSNPDVNFDTHIPLLSLPGIFGTNIDSIPSGIPYITVDPTLEEHWRKKISGNNNFKIGITWAGRPTYKDRFRSCSLADFAPLAAIHGITFYSLQKGPASREVLNPPERMKIINLDNELKDFADTAAVMQNLDLVISTDTAVVHLAGALGKPIWTLLHSAPDWRWFLNREESPWYPGMRLFKQAKHNDWTEVFEQVERRLLNIKVSCGYEA
ncbi:MAG: tetratricopeptide repeat protein [Candidatus Brocadiaceae bacterium]|nr:tetratricopeptide repeat protein [Candidatus Brocadiaceae bacterium]